MPLNTRMVLTRATGIAAVLIGTWAEVIVTGAGAGTHRVVGRAHEIGARPNSCLERLE